MSYYDNRVKAALDIDREKIDIWFVKDEKEIPQFPVPGRCYFVKSPKKIVLYLERFQKVEWLIGSGDGSVDLSDVFEEITNIKTNYLKKSELQNQLEQIIGNNSVITNLTSKLTALDNRVKSLEDNSNYDLDTIVNAVVNVLLAPNGDLNNTVYNKNETNTVINNAINNVKDVIIEDVIEDIKNTGGRIEPVIITNDIVEADPLTIDDIIRMS